MVSDTKANLSSLPPEILSKIISHQTSASSLRRLSQVNRTFNQVVQQEGWRTFVRENFPSFHTPPLWKEAAHALTTLSRNFDRRALIVRHVDPRGPVFALPEGRRLRGWKKPIGQTMGFRPVIDSRLDLTGNTWDTHRETLAYAAGAELVLRCTHYKGKRVAANQRQRKPAANHSWTTYREPGTMQGRDDITCLHLVPDEIVSPTQPSSGKGRGAVVGRANGSLNVVDLSRTGPGCVRRGFDTLGSSVQQGDVMLDSDTPLLSICLSNNHAAIYSLQENSPLVQPLSSKNCVDPTSSTRVWSTKFLSDKKLAVGRGMTDSPLHVYDILPTGISDHPREFKTGDQQHNKMTTTYAIVPIDEAYQQGGGPTNLLASGTYSGTVKLHDLRSPRNFEAVIADPTEFSPIFSLLMKGRERLIAGGGQHNLIKVFDLRMPGGREYSYSDNAKSLDIATSSHSRGMDDNMDILPANVRESGWDFFAGGRNQPYNKRFGGTVYSLSSPSPYSPQIYAGLEDTIMDINFSSIYDQHPDPLFNNSIERLPRGDIFIKNTWLRDYNDPVSLSMYEQSTRGSFELLVQRDVGPKTSKMRTIPGYDERWVSKAAE